MMDEDLIRKELDTIRASLVKIDGFLTEARSAFNPEWIREWAAIPAYAPLLKAIAKAESNFNPRAVSPVGAEGLMQLMPAIQRHFHVKDPLDPRQSVKGAEKLLQEEFERFKDIRLALAAYNAGSPKVNRALLKGGGGDYDAAEPYLPLETRAYVPKVMEYYERYRNEWGEPLIVV